MEAMPRAAPSEVCMRIMRQDVGHTLQMDPPMLAIGACPKPMLNCGAAIFSDRAWKMIAQSLGLSGRQLQMARGLFNDRTEFAIAASLGISAHTVHTHFDRLHQKLGVVDRVGVVLRVTEAFLTLTASPESGLPPICARRAAGRCPLQ